MSLSHELISQFAKIVKEDKKQSSESTVYGTVVTDGNGNKYVKLDGSDQLTPLSDDERPSADTATSIANEGERVSVLIKDHTATVTGNISSPAVRAGDFNDLNDQVTDIKQFDIVLAERVQANEGYIKRLQTDKASVGALTAATAKITELETNKANIEELNAAKADITDLKTSKIDTDVANAKFATIERLDATIADIDSLETSKANIEDLSATTARITELENTKLSTEQAEITYANIDFTNITEAAITKIFTESGIIKDLVVSEGHITGELVGVTIKGDIIEGGTVKADKLVVKGSDGLFYKLNTDGVTTTAEQTEYNSLDGSVITAKSVTAEKINVNDLVAFGATIGGFNITNESIYSGVKSSVDNTTRGIYQDKNGQFAIGDSDNFLKFYKDSDDNYKLVISASSILIRSGDTATSVDTVMNDVETKVNNLQIGGRNLLVGTSEYLSHTGKGAENECSSDYDVSSYYIGLPSLVGTYLTISFRWETDATSGTITPQWNDTPLRLGSGDNYSPNITVSSDNQSGFYSFTWEGDSTLDTGGYWGIEFRTDGLTGTVTIKDCKLEMGSKPSTWSKAPEDVQTDIQNQTGEISKTLTESVSSIQVNVDSITTSVGNLETSVNNNIDHLREEVELRLTKDSVNILIENKIQNSVTNVETSTGFKFDEDGLNISKDGSETNTQITENGMTVIGNEFEEVILEANKDGVVAKNLEAFRYLTIGNLSRFETIMVKKEDGNYELRTACFMKSYFTAQVPSYG